ncbi:hypothetical protein QBC42DRAFT_350082 [Cladorrhinum samala]|uniref:Shugoshin C-terminal domain-containing protein n=1 Tax=Cladorrhinum samala TaxID=585594 RepID=A0AAV9H9Z9_9PEZI|nr:hypothetical protein QBC42DRAFT_350082 [Cladorrhinum samala]
MPRNLDLALDELDKYDEQLMDAELTRARLVKAKELRDKKREALSQAATLAISAVQARVKDKVLKFNAKQKERKARTDLELGRWLEQLMKSRDESLSQMIKTLLDQRQHTINLAVQLQTVHRSLREDLESALRTKGPPTTNQAVESNKAAEVKEPAKEEEDDIDMQDLFDFAMKVSGEAREQRSGGESSKAVTVNKVMAKPTTIKASNYTDRKQTKNVEEQGVGNKPSRTTRKDSAEDQAPDTAKETADPFADLKWTDDDMLNLGNEQNTYAREDKQKEVEIIDLDGIPSILPKLEQLPEAETRKQKNSPLRTYSRKGTKSDAESPGRVVDTKGKQRKDAPKGRKVDVKGNKEARVKCA